MSQAEPAAATAGAPRRFGPPRDEPASVGGGAALERFVPGPSVEQVGREGRLVVARRIADLDEDGREDAILIEGELGEEGPDPARLRLTLWRREAGASGAPSWRRVFEGQAEEATRVARLAVLSPGCGETRQVLVELVDERPDEARHALLVYGALASAPVVRLRLVHTGAHRDEASTLDPLRAGAGLSLDFDAAYLGLRGPGGEERFAVVSSLRAAVSCREGRLQQDPVATRATLVPLATSAEGPASSLGAGRGPLTLDARGATVRGLRLRCAAPSPAGSQPRRVVVDGLLPRPIELELDAVTPTRTPGVFGAGWEAGEGAPPQLWLLLERPRTVETVRVRLDEDGPASCPLLVELLGDAEP